MRVNVRTTTTTTTTFHLPGNFSSVMWVIIAGRGERGGGVPREGEAKNMMTIMCFGARATSPSTIF